MKEYLSITLEAKTLSPVVSGEIKSDEIERRSKEGINKPCRITGDGKVAIPIYGVIRSYLEKTLRESGTKVCDTGARGSKGCGACILCDLFGHLGRRGRAIIDDLKSIEDFKKIVKPTFHSKISRETFTVTDSLNIDEIQENVMFKGNIKILDPKPTDLELIATAVRAINEFGVGGWLRRGRGRVELKIASVEKKSWTEFLNKGKEDAKKFGV
jgi:CRISPR/Cas system CSM-associated protein Csm3 (group 7 of RAMP superfamily)